MWALQAPVAAPATPAWRDARLVMVICVASGALAATGAMPPEAAAVAGVAAVHGGLITTALFWNGVDIWRAAVPVGLLVLARVVAAIHPMGALAYLAVPVWLLHCARAGGLRRAGLGLPVPWAATVVGALAGAALALHLFTCASRTLGYGIAFVPRVALPALAYDLGANVVSAELFFRGAVLAELWRRWRFAPALAAAAAAAALRYCLDPFAATTELRLGAAVYMTLLAVLNGLLYRWTGNLMPGLAAAAVFFIGYRLLARG